MNQIGLHKWLRKLRVRLANRILPKLSRTVLDDVVIMNITISSYSKQDLIPREHYEKVWMEIFKLVEDNVIFSVRGFRKGKIYETKIFYVSKKLIFKDSK